MKYKYLFFVFLIFCCCGCSDSFIGSEKIIWNQDHTHYIHTINTSDGHVSVLIDGIEYLRFETDVVLMGRWVNENEIKIVSNIEPMINRINKCPIPIKYKVAERYADLVSDSLFQQLLDPRFK